jgi:hypothetical protein
VLRTTDRMVLLMQLSHDREKEFVQKICDTLSALGLIYTVGSHFPDINSRSQECIVIENFGCDLARKGVALRFYSDNAAMDSGWWERARLKDYCACNYLIGSNLYEESGIKSFLNCFQWYGHVEDKPFWHDASGYLDMFPELKMN